MRFWRKLLGGLVLWAAHFFAVYIISSALPGTQTARILVLIATGLALAVASWLAFKAAYALRRATDGLDRWTISLSLLGYALAGAAIIYQGLPAAIQ